MIAPILTFKDHPCAQCGSYESRAYLGGSFVFGFKKKLNGMNEYFLTKTVLYKKEEIAKNVLTF